MKKQLAVVELRNRGEWLYEFNAKRKPTLDRIVRWLVDNVAFDEERDSVTLLDEPEIIQL